MPSDYTNHGGSYRVDQSSQIHSLHKLLAPDQVFEVRLLKVRTSATKPPRNFSGYFDADHLPELVQSLTPYLSKASGIHFTLNPLKPEVLARRRYRIDFAAPGDSATDGDVTTRRWLLLDLDPVRASGISATDSEKQSAMSHSSLVTQFLDEQGWPAPVILDSGNGVHLLYRIHLPVEDGSLLKAVLNQLGDTLDTTHVRLDRSVSNSGRLGKLPGTMARKGDSSPERPHRMATVLTMPDCVEVVDRRLLERLVGNQSGRARASGTGAARPGTGWVKGAPIKFPDSKVLRVEVWLQRCGVGYRVKPERDQHGRTVYVLQCCPFNAEHRDPDACVMQDVNGKMSAHCFHNSCIGNGWQQFKEAIGQTTEEDYEKAAHECSPTKAELLTAPERAVITISADTEVCQSMQQITDILLRAGNVFRYGGQIVSVDGKSMKTIVTPPELAGFINGFAEVQTVNSKGGTRYCPLPVQYAATWLNHTREHQRLQEVRIFTEHRVYTPEWRLLPPGLDPSTGIHIQGDRIEPLDGITHWEKLLKDFCFTCTADRANYMAMALTIVLMPRFIGAKPAVIFTANQPGLGKTLLAQILSIVRHGQSVPTLTFNPNDEEFEKRIGSVLMDGITSLVVDNAKSHLRGKPVCLESAVLERLITDEIASVRILGLSKSIKMENSLLVMITANHPSVGKDLLSRSVIVNLHYEGDPTCRRFTLTDPEGYARTHRNQLLGELFGMVEVWKSQGCPLGSSRSRFDKREWAPIISGILGANRIEGFLGATAESSKLDPVLNELKALLVQMLNSPHARRCSELLDLAIQTKVLQKELGTGSQKSMETRLGTILSDYAGSRINLDDGQVVMLEHHKDRSTSLYQVRRISG